MHGWHDPSAKPGGMFSKRVARPRRRAGSGQGPASHFEELLKKDAATRRAATRAGSPSASSTSSSAVALASSPEEKVCNLAAAADGSMSSILTVGSARCRRTARPSISWSRSWGRRSWRSSTRCRSADRTAHLGDVMEFRVWGMTEWLARPMLAVLKAIHFVLPNWGVAIIILTILLKAVTWFPTQKSMKSMKAMAKLKPEMDKLKERFGDDKNQLNLATMELYKKHGVNPLGGCLPVLIQMPIYIALYSMLGNSVELYRSPFVGWIRDLTAADPYFVLPLLTGVLMFVQQRTQPTPPDSQQKMMMYMMPVMFTAFSIFLPAGLTIYILTNTVLTFLQQWLMNRGDGTTRPQGCSDDEAGEGMMEEAAQHSAADPDQDGRRARGRAVGDRRARHARGEGAGDGPDHRQEGQTLDSLQYMVNKIVSKRLGEARASRSPSTPKAIAAGAPRRSWSWRTSWRRRRSAPGGRWRPIR